MKPNDFIFVPQPLILRGLSLDQQTQIGFCGTPLQVLHQQGYMAEEQSLRLVLLPKPLREQTRICGDLNQDCRKKLGFVCHADNCQDEESNEDMTNEVRGLQDGGK